ncbi:MAG: flagellar hook-length control protein FliK [Thiobacillus sp.]|nr:flagellar hook-length control protein FliK [Thiobacillus sp.]
MNASLANINSSNPVQSQSAAGKSQESAAETPFSQVLSSEIAQKSRGSDKQDASPQESAPKPEPVDAKSTESVKAEVPQDAAVADPAQNTALPVSAETFLALALNPGLSKSVSTGMKDAESDLPTAQKVDAQTGREPKKGLPARTLKTEPFDAKATGAKPGVALSAKAAETAFAGQVSAARQAESIKVGDQPQDLLNNTIMRAIPQVSVEGPTAVSGASANHLAPSVGAAAWGQALGEKMVWMAAGALQTATLTLNPPNMGPMQIVLNISNEQATASFFSAQPEVRQALEAAFPRLREMMSEAGIQLGQATVSADTPQQNAQEQSSQRAGLRFPNQEGTLTGEMNLSPSSALQSGRGLVDTFA